MTVEIRPVLPTDYDRVIAVVDAWWGDRHMAEMLPRLFFTHFANTSFVAEEHGELAGFIIGFLSQAAPDEAYVHFVGVAPEHRKTGLGRRLYERFFEACRAADRHVVRAVTSPVNRVSIAAHQALGFEVVPGPAERDGVPLRPDYDGPDGDRVLFVKRI